MSDDADVVIVGAGLAGLAAGAYLAPRLRVVLVEAAAETGGQCAGGRRGNHTWDYGVHGVYPRYAELASLLDFAGRPLAGLQHADEQHVIAPDGTPIRVRIPRLPAPLHCVAHAARLPTLSSTERLRLLAGAARLLSACPSAALDEMSIERLSCLADVPRTAFRLVYEPLAWVGFFLPPAELSAAAYLSALCFLVTGKSDSWRARWVAAPNNETLVDPLVGFIERHGGVLLLATRATGIQVMDGRVRGVEVTSRDNSIRLIRTRAAICAAQPGATAELMATALGGGQAAAALRRLGSTAVHTLRLTFEPGPRPPLAHGVALTERHGFVFFHLGHLAGGRRADQRRVVEIQCGPDVMAEGQRFLQARARSLLPDRAASPRLVDIEPAGGLPYAAYRIGSSSSRPGIAGPWPNLFFAGDWVSDPHERWFMERAAATGRAAAHAVLGLRPPGNVSRLAGPGTRMASVAAGLLLGSPGARKPFHSGGRPKRKDPMRSPPGGA